MKYEISAGEVLEVIYNDDKPNLIYGLKVKELGGGPASDVAEVTTITAKPLNIGFLRIPIVGEAVLLIKAPSSYGTSIRNTSDTYYLDVVSMQSSIHHNSLPTQTAKTVQKNMTSGDAGNYNSAAAGNINKPKDPKVDDNFSENAKVQPLQHYIGDMLIEGRYGNSIRFSTTPKSGKFTVQPKWSNGKPAAPITIFRNSVQEKGGKINGFITEDFNKEDNVIVQASGQNIEFEQASKVLSSTNKYSLTSWKDENWGTTPQTLISSGRIVFNSFQKEIIAFAKKGIALSSETAITIDAKDMVSLNAKKMELGTGSEEPLILGKKWKAWMEDLIDAIGDLTDISPVGPCAPTKSDPQWSKIASLKAKIPTLLSDISFTKKS
jgi:hypothetical protein